MSIVLVNSRLSSYGRLKMPTVSCSLNYRITKFPAATIHYSCHYQPMPLNNKDCLLSLVLVSTVFQFTCKELVRKYNFLIMLEHKLCPKYQASPPVLYHSKRSSHKPAVQVPHTLIQIASKPPRR
jgi:hypothetical protein